jgi:hypothetical protein
MHPVAAMNSSSSPGWYCIRCRRVQYQCGDSVEAARARLPRLFFRCTRTPSAGLGPDMWAGKRKTVSHCRASISSLADVRAEGQIGERTAEAATGFVRPSARGDGLPWSADAH